MTRIVILVICLHLAGTLTQAQEIIIDEQVDNSAYENQRGPNLKKHRYFFLNTRFLIPGTQNQIQIDPGNSWEWGFGFRHTRKLVKHFSVGYTVDYNRLNARITQHAGKNVPNAYQHDKENLAYNYLGADIYQRLTIGNWGNRLGLIVDAGIYGQWMYKSIHVIRDKTPPVGYEASRSVFKHVNPGYNLPYAYGLRFRAGFDRYVLTSGWRLSRVFEENRGFGDLPVWTFGFEIKLI
jgi:hypothetical protein